MTYKTITLDVDEAIYPQLIAFLRLLPAKHCVIHEEETTVIAQQKFAALAGSWQGEALQRAPYATS
jgi:hypothetical protein